MDQTGWRIIELENRLRGLSDDNARLRRDIMFRSGSESAVLRDMQHRIGRLEATIVEKNATIAGLNKQILVLRTDVRLAKTRAGQLSGALTRLQNATPKTRRGRWVLVPKESPNA